MPAEVRHRQQRTLQYASNGRTSEILSRGSVYRELYLRLQGQTTDATNSQANTTSAEEWGIIQRLDLIANNTDVIKSLSGEELWWLNYYLYGRAPNITAAIGAGGANPSFDSHLILPLWMPRSIRPMDTALDARVLADLKIEVTWGTHTDISSDATGFESAPTLEVRSMEAFNTEGRFATWRLNRIRQTISASNTEQQIILPVGEMYRSFLIHTQDAGVDQGDIINNVKIISGTTVFADYDDEVLRNIVPLRMGIEAPPTFRSNNRAVAGWYFLDLVTDGYLKEAIDTVGFSEFIMELDVTVGGGTTTIDILPSRIIPIRGNR